jgi:hypothetical protein
MYFNVRRQKRFILLALNSSRDVFFVAVFDVNGEPRGSTLIEGGHNSHPPVPQRSAAKIL